MYVEGLLCVITPAIYPDNSFTEHSLEEHRRSQALDQQMVPECWTGSLYPFRKSLFISLCEHLRGNTPIESCSGNFLTGKSPFEWSCMSVRFGQRLVSPALQMQALAECYWSNNCCWLRSFCHMVPLVSGSASADAAFMSLTLRSLAAGSECATQAFAQTRISNKTPTHTYRSALLFSISACLHHNGQYSNAQSITPSFCPCLI